MMKIRDFTIPELDRFRELCNFTDDELQVFELKAKDKTHVQISIALNISEPQVAKLSKRIKNKMIRVL